MPQHGLYLILTKPKLTMHGLVWCADALVCISLQLGSFWLAAGGFYVIFSKFLSVLFDGIFSDFESFLNSYLETCPVNHFLAINYRQSFRNLGCWLSSISTRLQPSYQPRPSRSAEIDYLHCIQCHGSLPYPPVSRQFLSKGSTDTVLNCQGL